METCQANTRMGIYDTLEVVDHQVLRSLLLAMPVAASGVGKLTASTVARYIAQYHRSRSDIVLYHSFKLHFEILIAF